MFSDFEKYENVPDEWEPPSELPYVSHGNKKSHLLDPDSCDQYSVVHEGGDRVNRNLISCSASPREMNAQSLFDLLYRFQSI